MRWVCEEEQEQGEKENCGGHFFGLAWIFFLLLLRFCREGVRSLCSVLSSEKVVRTEVCLAFFEWKCVREIRKEKELGLGLDRLID